MATFSRRNLLAAGAVAGGAAAAATAAHAASQGGVFGNPDRPAEGRINAAPGAADNPGPQNRTLSGEFPSMVDPPATDVDGMDLFWASFNNAHRRTQSGGWAREVTQGDFALSDAVSGVNMRLSRGGVRELHWHQQAEWAVMTDGRCRITVLDAEGRPYLREVKVGDLWYFPAGLPHSLTGVGASGCEFTIVFDNGHASEFNTLPMTDWLAHTPPEVLAENFGMPASAFKSIPMNNLWIYQGPEPMPLDAAQRAIRSPLGEPDYEFAFSTSDMKANKITAGGEVKIIDSTNFPVSKTIAAALVRVKPGGMRELHWHPNADEWQYYIAGEARMTVFNTGPRAQTADFKAGDVGVVKKGLGHYVLNTGSTDLVFMEIFKADKFQEVSLAQWLAGTPPDLIASHLNMDPALFEKFKLRQVVVPV